MWREIKVLLVDDNEQRKHDMHVLLDFLGEEAFESDSKNWKSIAENTDDPMDIVACILGSSNSKTTAEMLSDISDWDKGMPIIYVGDDELPSDLSEDIRRAIIAHVTMPPSYNKLLDSLHRAQIFREHFAQSCSW